METVIFYSTLGFWHVIDLNGLDHLYFIMALSLPFSFFQWKKLLWWVTLFTFGHSLSLMGNYYLSFVFSSYWIELLIPITIALSTVPLLKAHVPKSGLFTSGLTFFFGLIHGLGFGRYFGLIVSPDAAATSLFSFAIGVELAQLLIVLGVLSLHFLIRNFSAAVVLWRKILGWIIFLLAFYMIVERI